MRRNKIVLRLKEISIRIDFYIHFHQQRYQFSVDTNFFEYRASPISSKRYKKCNKNPGCFIHYESH